MRGGDHRDAERGGSRLRPAGSGAGRGPADAVRSGPDVARARLARIAAAERSDAALDPGNLTRAWLHDARVPLAVVLLHGFTNNPRQFDVLGPRLAARGHAVVAPRLPYHGERDRLTASIARLTPADLEAAALDAVAIAAHAARRVVVAGISVGATLAVWCAMRVAVDAVAVSPFFGLRGFADPALAALTATLGGAPNRFVWWDPRRKEAQLPHHAYPRFSTHALAACLRMGDDAIPAALGGPHGERIALVLNRREPIVSNALARRRGERAAALGLRVQRYTLDDAPPIHDVIEPTIPEAKIDAVYPVLEAALEAD